MMWVFSSSLADTENNHSLSSFSTNFCMSEYLNFSSMLLFSILNNPVPLVLTHRSDFFLSVVISSKLSHFVCVCLERWWLQLETVLQLGLSQHQVKQCIAPCHLCKTLGLRIVFPFCATVIHCQFKYLFLKRNVPVSPSEIVHCVHFCFQYELPEITVLYFCLYHPLPVSPNSRLIYCRRQEMFQCF